MSKEAMKLACKALRDCHYYMINAGLPNQSLLNEAFTAYMELEAALAKQPAQQEPVAVVSGYYGGQCVILPTDPARIYNSNTPLYTAPQPCPTCEALARTVMLDQTSHDTLRKPADEMVVAAARVLSDRQAAACNVDCGDMWKLHGNDFIEDARAALESAHGIREKNT